MTKYILPDKHAVPPNKGVLKKITDVEITLEILDQSILLQPNIYWVGNLSSFELQKGAYEIQSLFDRIQIYNSRRIRKKTRVILLQVNIFFTSVSLMVNIMW